MGTFKVNMGIGDPQGREYEPVETLMDTGATYTTIPGSLLRRLGVGADRQVEFELVDGSVIERDVGQTWVQINGDTAIVPVVFADEGSAPLLGAVTLEIFLLTVDPIRQRLVPVRGNRMTRRSSCADLAAHRTALDPASLGLASIQFLWFGIRRGSV